MRYRRRRIARRTAGLIELGRELTDADVLLETDCAGPAYGLPGEGTLDAIRVCARQEGMLTDPVYEGKSMHGMIDMVRSDKLPQGSRVLYAHLGGVPTSDWDDSVGIDNPGQSGNVDSPHYRDLYPLWARGRYFPIFFSAPKVRSVTESRLVLEPARPQ